MLQFVTIQPSQRHHLEDPEVYRLERRANKNMATESGLYYSISSIYSGYYSRLITRKFRTALSAPCCLF